MERRVDIGVNIERWDERRVIPSVGIYLCVVVLNQFLCV
jgi:hypothetical protein